MKSRLLLFSAIALGLVLFGCVGQTPSPTPSATPTLSPSATPSLQPTPSVIPTPTPRASPTVTITPTPQPTPDYSCNTDADCGKGGCSSTICANKNYVQSIITTCEWRPEYVCYQQASCLCVQNKCQFDSGVAQCLQRMQNQSTPTPGSGSGYA